MQKNAIAKKHATLVLNATTYAYENHLNIRSKDDVTKILKVLDPKHANEETVDTFIPVLSIMFKMMKGEVNEIKKRKTN